MTSLNTVFRFDDPATGAWVELTMHEEAGGIAIDAKTSSGAGRGSLVHVAGVNNGNLKVRVNSALGTEILVLPNGPGDPLYQS